MFAEPRLPLTDRLRAQVPRIPATWALAALNAAVFVALLQAGAGLWHVPNAIQLAWGANFAPATEDGQWWRLGTALFLHFGLLHLGVNLLALVEAGRFVERLLGSGRFLLLYFGAGVAGNLLSLAVQGNHAVSGGASGAIFGLWGALLVLLWRMRHQLDPAEFRWLFWGAAVFVVVNIAFGFFVTGIDNGAHLGGLCSGLLAAVALERRPPGAPGNVGAVRGAAGAALAICVAGLVAALPEPAYDWSDEQAARSEIRQFVGTDAALTLRWNALIEEGERQGLSFDELATRVEDEVAASYGQSFEHLSALRLDPRAPSAAALEAVRHYAGARHAASQELAEALRARDPLRARRALDKANAAGSASATSSVAPASPLQN